MLEEKRGRRVPFVLLMPEWSCTMAAGVDDTAVEVPQLLLLEPATGHRQCADADT